MMIHTGQHYDYKMSQVFFAELGLPGAEINLNVGSASHGLQTANILTGIENCLLKNKPDVSHVLLYGDTNSTLAGALAASKLNIPVVHVEAGLRSYNREMPEEINRVVTDHLSSLLFCSSEIGRQNLIREGINEGVHISGDIMLDAFELYSEIAAKKCNVRDILPPNIAENYFLLTIHRPINTDNSEILAAIVEGIGQLDTNIVWPVHPRNKSSIAKLKMPANVSVFEPFSYLEMLTVLNAATKVITDSGGLQKEAYWSKKPCITIRSETEWVETLHHNWNVLTCADAGAIKKSAETAIDTSTWIPLYGDGQAARIISEVIA